MSFQDDEFLARLLQTFSEEASEHIQTIISGLLVLEDVHIKNHSEKIEPIFRACHSLKGAARAVGLREIETLCQNLETLFASVKKKELVLNPDDFALIHQTIRGLEGMLAGDKSVSAGPFVKKIKTRLSSSEKISGTTEAILETSVIVDSDNVIKNEKNKEDEIFVPSSDLSSAPPHIFPSGVSSVRISEERLKNLYSTADDLLSYRLSSGSRLSDLKEILQKIQMWRWSLHRVEGDISLLKRKNTWNQETLDRVLAFLDNTRDVIGISEAGLSSAIRSLTQDQMEMDSVITGLIESIKEVVLIPVSSLTDSYPRMVRDIAREQKKNIHFSVIGADIEMDRRVLEIVRDPLIHILRNAVDHGIETQEIRIKKGKSANGNLIVNIDHTRANQVSFRITDDGNGIDPKIIGESAFKKKIISEEELFDLDDDEKIRLIFKSGMSTSKTITEVSGRGLGLAIVQEKLDQVGGKIKVISTVDQGTTFTLNVPVTLATFKGIMVYVENRPFFIPLKQVNRVLNPTKSDISTIEGRFFFTYNDKIIPVAYLGAVLGIRSGISEKTEAQTLVIFKAFNGKFGVFVQRIVGAQEIVIRDLGPQLQEIPFISGVAILNNSLVVPVLHMEEVARTMHEQNKSDKETEERFSGLPARKRILIVEDSITSRMLLKNILEGAGYDIETAVDGLDAFSKLKTNSFDLVISDVDMPRMNGFMLTEKIRSEKKISDLPIILVTSLDSREDKEHGINVGANAYIIKSTFDQGNLLEVIQKLIVTGT